MSKESGLTPAEQVASAAGASAQAEFERRRQRREAAAIQVALGVQLPDLNLTVTPIVCLNRGELPFFNKTVRGVRLASGAQLERVIRQDTPRLSADQVERIASVADRIFTPAAS